MSYEAVKSTGFRYSDPQPVTNLFFLQLQLIIDHAFEYIFI